MMSDGCRQYDVANCIQGKNDVKSAKGEWMLKWCWRLSTSAETAIVLETAPGVVDHSPPAAEP